MKSSFIICNSTSFGKRPSDGCSMFVRAFAEGGWFEDLNQSEYFWSLFTLTDVNVLVLAFATFCC